MEPKSERGQVNQGMDDQFDEMLMRTQRWIKSNPSVALLIAAGAGVLAGGILAAATRHEEPATLSDRMGDRAREWALESRRLAGEAGSSVREFASDAGSTISREGGKAARAVSDRSGDIAELIGDAVKTSVLAVLAKKASNIMR